MKLEKRIARQRLRRGYRVRNRIRAAGRLRLSVCRSNRQISAQIIDDVAGRTLVSASSLEKELGGPKQDNGNKASAARVGKALAERALQAGIKDVALTGVRTSTTGELPHWRSRPGKADFSFETAARSAVAASMVFETGNEHFHHPGESTSNVYGASQCQLTPQHNPRKRWFRSGVAPAS